MHLILHNLNRYTISRTVSSLICYFFLSSIPAVAETVTLKLPSGINASANFHKGLTSLPAVLILHGFLQTSHSPPMSSLADNLSSRGYTVLSPTISLDINNRNQTLPCEAIHTQTIEQEVAEVAYWVNWLGNKNPRSIVLVGFSSAGNHEILLYDQHAHHSAVKKAILISLNPVTINNKELMQTREVMQSNHRPLTNKISQYTLGYCKNSYSATANSYLSFTPYNEDRILEMLRHTPVSTDVILGSYDTVLPPNWQSKIKAQQTSVTIIDKANHFFDGTYEFDLAEIVEAILKKLPG